MARLSRIGAGESITVQLIRDGKRIELPLTLGEPPER
jgi:S1-C subfamily serine protease